MLFGFKSGPNLLGPMVSLGRPSHWAKSEENRYTRRPTSYDIAEKLRIASATGVPISGGLGEALTPLIKELSPVLKEVGSALGEGLRGGKK